MSPRTLRTFFFFWGGKLVSELDSIVSSKGRLVVIFWVGSSWLAEIAAMMS